MAKDIETVDVRPDDIFWVHSRFDWVKKYIRLMEKGENTEELFSDFCNTLDLFIRAKYPEMFKEFKFYDYRDFLNDANLDEDEIRQGKVTAYGEDIMISIIQRELNSARWNNDPYDSFREPEFLRWLRQLIRIDSRRHDYLINVWQNAG